MRTRIGAFAIDAGTIVRTFRTDDTFGTTVWRCSDVIWLTRADGVAVVVTTIAIRTAWRWLTWEVVLAWRWCLWNFFALEEWIASETSWTRARRNVIFHMTNGQSTADADARIDTLESHASQAIIAIEIRFTFATTSAIDVVRIAFVAIVTEASSGIVVFSAFSIWSAW